MDANEIVQIPTEIEISDVSEPVKELDFSAHEFEDATEAEQKLKVSVDDGDDLSTSIQLLGSFIGDDEEESDDGEDAIVEVAPEPGAKAGTSETSATIQTERNNNKSKTKLQTPDGVDLFPPGGSKGSKASVAWTYGGLKKDDKGNILKDTIYCSLCPKTFKYHSSPSNLTDHLNSKHIEAMMDLEATKKQSQAKLTDFKFLKPSSTDKYKPSHPKQQQFRANLKDWIVKDKRPFAIVGDMGLKKVVANLDAKLTLPHRTTITKDIAASYVKNRKIQTEKFKNVDSFTCTNDGGTSLGNSSFIAMTVHWIDDSFESKKKMIDMKPIEGKTAQEYRQAVDDSLEKHGIKAKTFSFTTDNEPTMLKSFSAADRSGCFAHIESKASQKALDSSKVLKKVLKKLRKISTKSNKSPKFKRSIKKEQIERRLQSITLKQEIATRFTSTKIMFNSFLPSNKDEEIDTKDNIM